MPDVLLAHSFFLKNDPKQIAKMRPYPPLGTLYAASNLRANGCSVVLFDAMLAEDMREFERMLERHQPRIVALYEDQFNFLNKMCLNHSREATCTMAALARSRGAKVIAAGADVSDHPEVYFQHGVEYALLGEPDHTLIEIALRLLGRGEIPLENIAGVATPGPFAGRARRTASRSPERNPDVFPFPAWDLLDTERYRKAWKDSHGYFSVNMVSTRGCPFHCNWCAKPIWGQRYAMRSPAAVAEEMALIKRMLNPDHIWFADDIFALQPRWVVEFAEEVRIRNARIPFTIQSRVDLITEAGVEALALAGCSEIWLGVESGSQRILDAMDKGIRVHHIPLARQRLKSAGIRACYFLQFGYPGEEFEDILATASLVRETLPDEIGISVSNPLPGTKFHQMVKAQLGEKDHWEHSNDLAMLFQGTYRTAFYRSIHSLMHRELEARLNPERGNLDPIEAAWFELRRSEAAHRNAHPTQLSKPYDLVPAPDLSRRWN